MWRSLAATDGDVVVFVDADLRSFTPAYITGLLGPLLLNDAEDGIEHDDGQDGGSIDPLSEQGGDEGGSDQEDDDEVVELLPEH